MTAIENPPVGQTQAQSQGQQQDPFQLQAGQDIQQLLADVQTQTLYAALVDARAEVHRLNARIAELEKPKARNAAKKRATPAKKSTAKKTTDG